MRRLGPSIVTLNIVVGDEPPTSFRVFRAGPNATSKGTFLFDDAAARSVMADYAAHGADVMLDLEHLSLEQESRSFDPDARGWCRLEVRGGELWAVDVRWTPDGDRRLRDKTQRYISPAFEIDPESKRIARVLNIAITAMPATHQLAPLVAANAVATAYGEGKNMDKETLQKAIEAIKSGDSESALAVLEALIISEASGEEEQGEAPAAEPAPEMMADAAPAQDDEEKKPGAMAATTRIIKKLSGKTDIVEALADIAEWRKSHLALTAERAALAVERAALELADRKKLCAELVALGKETPADVWEDPSKGNKPSKFFAALPLDVLRHRVASARSSKPTTGTGSGAPKPPAAKTPAAGGKTFQIEGQPVELSARELRICEESGTKPEDYARNKLIVARAKGTAA